LNKIRYLQAVQKNTKTNMRLDHLRTGVREAVPAQDAQEVGEVPLSVAELLAVLRSDEPLDLYDVEFAFSSLADNFNNGACFAAATECAVQAAKAARPAPALPGPDSYDFSHVLPAMERCCRALETGVVDRRAFAADAEELATLYSAADVRATRAVSRYVEAALPSIMQYKEVPPLTGFSLEGIPARRYRALGAALLKAVSE